VVRSTSAGRATIPATAAAAVGNTGRVIPLHLSLRRKLDSAVEEFLVQMRMKVAAVEEGGEEAEKEEAEEEEH